MGMFSFGGDTGETQESLARKRAIAEAMMQGQTKPVDAWSGAANAVEKISGALLGRQIRSQQAELDSNRNQTVAQALAAMRGTPEWKNPDNPDEGIPASAGNNAVAYEMLAKSGDPQLVDLAMKLQMQEQAKQSEDQTWQSRFNMQNEAQDARLTKTQEFQAQQARAVNDRMLEAARLSQGSRAPVAIMTPEGPRYVSPNDAVGQRPYSMRAGGGNLPVSMQKAEDADLEAVDLANNISADLAAQRGALESGKFNVGPLDKLGYTIASATGTGGEQTQAYNSYRATLEKMRNDSLRLNKGVQTEGDAVRAWNELFTALGSNDKATVANRLQEIEKMNNRAVAEAKRRIDVRRQRNGTDDFDWQSYPAMGSPLAGGQSSDDDLINKYLSQ
tara:strand:+ start:347 stop:1513 length:1167 start_codon:yes stop_codon:yes gene_type:complete